MNMVPPCWSLTPSIEIGVFPSTVLKYMSSLKILDKNDVSGLIVDNNFFFVVSSEKNRTPHLFINESAGTFFLPPYQVFDKAYDLAG